MYWTESCFGKLAEGLWCLVSGRWAVVSAPAGLRPAAGFSTLLCHFSTGWVRHTSAKLWPWVITCVSTQRWYHGPNDSCLHPEWSCDNNWIDINLSPRSCLCLACSDSRMLFFWIMSTQARPFHHFLTIRVYFYWEITGRGGKTLKVMRHEQKLLINSWMLVEKWSID